MLASSFTRIKADTGLQTAVIVSVPPYKLKSDGGKSCKAFIT